MTGFEAREMLNKIVNIHEEILKVKSIIKKDYSFNVSLEAYDNKDIHVDESVFNDIIESNLYIGEITTEEFETYDAFCKKSSFIYKGYTIFFLDCSYKQGGINNV